MRGWIEFQRRCFERAFAAMWRSDVPFYLDMAGAFALGSLVHLARYGWQAVMDEWHVFVSYGFAAAASWAFLKFVVNAMFIAPYREYQDEHRDAEWLRNLMEVRERSGPDYTHWDKIDVFQLWQAACLWAEESLRKDNMSHRASGILWRLKANIAADEISLVGMQQTMVHLDDLLSEAGQTPQGIQDEATIKRSMLMRAAEAWGERPAFLFEDTRRTAITRSSDSLSLPSTGA